MCRRCSGTSIGRMRALLTTLVSPGSGIERELQIADAGLADVDVDPARRDAVRARQLNRLRREDRVAVVDLQLREGRAAVPNADLRAHRGARQADRRNLHVLELEVLRDRLGADADRVHGHAEARDLGDLRGVERRRELSSPSLTSTTAATRARLRAAQHAQQRVADVRDRPRRGHLLERRQLDHVAREREELTLKFDLSCGSARADSAVDRLLQPRMPPSP